MREMVYLVIFFLELMVTKHLMDHLEMDLSVENEERQEEISL